MCAQQSAKKKCNWSVISGNYYLIILMFHVRVQSDCSTSIVMSNIYIRIWNSKSFILTVLVNNVPQEWWMSWWNSLVHLCSDHASSAWQITLVCKGLLYKHFSLTRFSFKCHQQCEFLSEMWDRNDPSLVLSSFYHAFCTYLCHGPFKNF